MAQFVRILGEYEIAGFSVPDVMESDGQVAAEIAIDARRPGGGRYRDEEVHPGPWTAGAASADAAPRRTAEHAAAAAGLATTAR